MTPVRLKSTAPQSQVEHSTTEPPEIEFSINVCVQGVNDSHMYKASNASEMI